MKINKELKKEKTNRQEGKEVYNKAKRTANQSPHLQKTTRVGGETHK